MVILGCLTGCAVHEVRRVTRLDFIVPPKCITELTLVDCDSKIPPNCKNTKLKYQKGCEVVKVSQ